MTPKKIILKIILSVTIISTVVLTSLAKNPYPILFLGLFTIFIIYSVWGVPKHKSFSYMDQQRAFRASDRSDLIRFTLSSNSKNKEYNKSENILAILSLIVWILFSAGTGFVLIGLKDKFTWFYIGTGFFLTGSVALLLQRRMRKYYQETQKDR